MFCSFFFCALEIISLYTKEKKIQYLVIVVCHFRGPNFELMASASLCLDDTNDNIRTHDLKIENTGLYFVCVPKKFYF